jgi:hypothetical protein
MIQENKDLFIERPLCMITPYRVKARVYNHWRDEFQDETILKRIRL